MKSILLIALFALIECKEIQRSYIKTDLSENAATVEVGLYYESLCPGSKDFYINQFYPTFTKLNAATPKILTVNLVPYGNAHVSVVTNSTKNPQVTFVCQHGDQECVGNKLQSCAVAKFTQAQSLALTDCMFKSKDWPKPLTSATECTKTLNLDINVLTECADSLVGTALEYYMSGQTNSLVPVHKYVPWVTLDGVHTDDIEAKAMDDLLKLVCDTYTGSPKPTACDGK